MKLTLTREQIPLAWETVGVLRSLPRVDSCDLPTGASDLPGHRAWWCGSMDKAVDREWANALEAAITEAEHPMQTITLVKVGDADERAFWREAYALGRHRNHAPGLSPGLMASDAADEADVALDRYRKAFGGES